MEKKDKVAVSPRRTQVKNDKMMACESVHYLLTEHFKAAQHSLAPFRIETVFLRKQKNFYVKKIKDIDEKLLQHDGLP
jgi:hypothetical protein